MKNAFSKGVLRSITHSLGRFLAIAVIAALGTGFYAGLQMTQPDMKLAGDMYYDGTNLSDIRVVSTYGLTDAEVSQIAALDGVEGVMPAYETDVLATIEDVQYVIRMHSLDIDAAMASDTSDGESAVSPDKNYINRPLLVDGEWPSAANECVLSADAVTDGSIKVGDSVTVVEGTQDVEDALTATEYTVVGFARSSYYASSSSMGSTQLGSGVIDQYMYVPQTAFNEDNPYTEAFVTVAGAKDLDASAPEYDDLVARVTDRIDELAPGIAAARLADIQAEAQEELDENRAKFEKEEKDAHKKLNDAQKELDKGQKKLDDARVQLDDAAAAISSNESKLAQGEKDYEAGKAELASQKKSAKKSFKDAQAQIDKNKAEVDKGLKQLPGLKDQLSQAKAGLKQVDAGIKQVDAALSDLDGKAKQVADGIAQLEAVGPELVPDYDAQMTVLNGQAEEIAAGIAQAQAQKDELVNQRASLTDGIGQLEAGISQIEDGKAQLDAAQATLDEEKAKANKEFSKAEKKLDEAKDKLASGRKQLEQGKRDYAKGLAEYEDGVAELKKGKREFAQEKADALAKLDDAREELDDAQKDIDELELPDVYVLDRSKNIGVQSYVSDADRIGQIAQVFPFIFFLVAALVSLTTMTRMVDEERVLIGTYKALGYSNARIISKYLVYAVVASGIGSAVGIVALSLFLPKFIMMAYSIVYAVPPTPAPINVGIALFSAGLGIGITAVATAGAAASTLRESPAALMLPRAPKAGKRILLERIGFVWQRMSFSWKVTARNLFRYKRRFFMAVIGVAGCTALLLTGLGLQDSINDIIDKQYGELNNYNMVVRLDDKVSKDDEASIKEALANKDAVNDSTRAYTENMLATGVDADGNAMDEQRIELVVPQDPKAFEGYLVMRDRVTGVPVQLSGSGVVLTEKAANRLNVKVGDAFTVREEDSIGNAAGKGYTLTVGAITENYVGHYAYLTPAAYGSAFGEVPAAQTIYAKAASSESVRQALCDELLAIDDVKTAGFNDETISTYRNMLKSVNSVVVILVIAAALLAFVVLYNLTNINITERQREIATLKVLGFTPREVDAYIFREIMLLAMLGALVGLGLGVVMSGFVITTAEVDQVMFGRSIHAASFAIAFALTMVFATVVSLFMRGKLARINMVESLKSVE